MRYEFLVAGDKNNAVPCLLKKWLKNATVLRSVASRFQALGVAMGVVLSTISCLALCMFKSRLHCTITQVAGKACQRPASDVYTQVQITQYISRI